MYLWILKIKYEIVLDLTKWHGTGSHQPWIQIFIQETWALFLESMKPSTLYSLIQGDLYLTQCGIANELWMSWFMVITWQLFLFLFDFGNQWYERIVNIFHFACCYFCLVCLLSSSYQVAPFLSHSSMGGNSLLCVWPCTATCILLGFGEKLGAFAHQTSFLISHPSSVSKTLVSILII